MALALALASCAALALFDARANAMAAWPLSAAATSSYEASLSFAEGAALACEGELALEIDVAVEAASELVFSAITTSSR
ncbi:MAG TPA: hypothetical protein VGO62_02675 [Myxococcota bacterium]